MAKDAVDSVDDIDFDDNFEATRYGKEKNMWKPCQWLKFLQWSCICIDMCFLMLVHVYIYNNIYIYICLIFILI